MTIVQLPEFDEPPVAEVALSGQFQRLAGLRAVHLGRFYELISADYPGIDEQPPLPPVTEGDAAFGAQSPMFTFGAPPMSRHWFINPSSDRLVQVQQDRVVLNWRRQGPAPYPHYGDLRTELARLLPLYAGFVGSESLGGLIFTQGELTYTNVVNASVIDELGGFSELTPLIQTPKVHHLGGPTSFRGVAMFDIKDDRLSPPTRLYVEFGSGVGVPPAPSIITLTVRGAPMGSSAEDLLSFLDVAHEHLITSFAELTSEGAHRKWGRVK